MYVCLMLICPTCMQFNKKPVYGIWFISLFFTSHIYYFVFVTNFNTINTIFIIATWSYGCPVSYLYLVWFIIIIIINIIFNEDPRID